MVLTGADLNQQLICPCPCPCTYPYHSILDYTPTDRRWQSGQIDYFILDPPCCIEKPVKQLDLSQLVKRRNLTDQQATFWKAILDHDPLMCTIRVNN